MIKDAETLLQISCKATGANGVLFVFTEQQLFVQIWKVSVCLLLLA